MIRQELSSEVFSQVSPIRMKTGQALTKRGITWIWIAMIVCQQMNNLPSALMFLKSQFLILIGDEVTLASCFQKRMQKN